MRIPSKSAFEVVARMDDLMGGPALTREGIVSGDEHVVVETEMHNVTGGF